MLKQTAIAALSLILLSGAAIAGEGNDNMKAMRDRMDAQLQGQSQQQVQHQAPAQK
ncbi:hypothetical protein [Pseudogulbenkiania ferrooxidans]|uniref:Uncharacterized protein n=1 Tax=Pseudogulbenkiania ferrooxidans EGD-HP2 TaxID=1388764 RepID=A0ABP2XP72_9NEIS|nr:hypothetical protein [Pseudogulbenkiania ferrooxidans]ERE07317.1 hypothetical protein O166_06100 [Pseudogulbenkiania ferrooxidans EGD-HP2]